MAAPSTLISSDPSLSIYSQEPTRSPLGATPLKTTFAIGTRKSALALAQTEILTTILSHTHASFSFPIHASSTIGDKNQATALHAFNAKSLWTHELEAQLLAGETDLIAHSLKDMPTQLPAGCSLGAACVRTEKRDCVAMSKKSMEKGWRTLGDLPKGSVVGTSSLRRSAQVRALFPGLEIEDVRGNMGTRLEKLDNGVDEEGKKEKYAALILAAAGLQRIGLGDRVSSFLSWKEGCWLGAVGQGALGVEIRQGDKEVDGLCEALMRDGDEEEVGSGKRVWFEALAERSLLRTLEGGCSVPIGVETEWEGKEMGMRAVVMSVDGQKEVRGYRKQRVESREEAEAFGLNMARELVEKGAQKILEEITLNRKIIGESGNA